LGRTLKELDPRKTRKYLEIEECHDIEHEHEKGKLQKEYLRRLRLIVNTLLSARNKIQATGSQSVPVLMRKGADPARRSIHIRNYETNGICGEQVRSANTSC
jgi:hypothetical protein